MTDYKQNIHLIPEIIINIVDKYNNGKNFSNEKYALEVRLETIQAYISEALQPKEKNIFKLREKMT